MISDDLDLIVTFLSFFLSIHSTDVNKFLPLKPNYNNAYSVQQIVYFDLGVHLTPFFRDVF
jgi:hypothetical protein